MTQKFKYFYVQNCAKYYELKFKTQENEIENE